MVVEQDSSQMNQELERNVAHTLRSMGLSGQSIIIIARGGRVYLYGYAYSLEERCRIEDVTLAAPGVSSVENYLCVNLFA
jgi:osmotically-inducible protein OsmY